MKLVSGDDGPCELLFVGPRNLESIVRRVDPSKLLVDRAEFIQVANMMLAIVERAAAEAVANEADPEPTRTRQKG